MGQAVLSKSSKDSRGDAPEKHIQRWGSFPELAQASQLLPYKDHLLPAVAGLSVASASGQEGSVVFQM